MTGILGQPWRRVAAIVALAGAVALGGCGRRGPLDAPPAAALPPQPGQPSTTAQTAPAQQVQQPSVLGGASEASIGRDNNRMLAPPPSGKNEPFILDWLLN